MVKYRYISKIEVTESDDPKMPVGLIFLMLGKIDEKAMWRVEQETHNLVFARINVLEHFELPNLMSKQEAWDYCEKEIHPKIFA